MTRRLSTIPAAAAAAAAITALVLCATAQAITYAPTDQPGPALDVPTSTLRAAITCSPTVGHSDREPVLLVPGTWGTFENYWTWNFAPALSRLGIPWCGVTPPDHQLGDTQLAGQYDVYAIRYLYHASGNRKIAIVGHSQGGMQPRWALRFWPDTRDMVADDIGIAPDNQGATLESQFCTVTGTVHTCPLNLWQGATGSNFIQALNSRAQMFPGIDYTVIYSTNDLLIQPQDTPLYGPGSYRRISLQDVCPGHLSTHIQEPYDPVVWALTLDAITHQGPADPARLSRSVCSQSFMPGVSLGTVATNGSAFVAGAAAATAAAPESPTEPPLACYVTATCPATTRLNVTVTPRKTDRHRRTTLTILVTVDIDGITSPVPDADVWVGNGRHLHTNTTGQATTTIAFGKAGTRKVIARAAEYLPTTTTITVANRRKR